MRTIVIGDIHGSLQSLTSGLEKLNYDSQNDRLICLGDYVDGWKDSVGVIKFLIGLQDKSKYDNIYILGNHDKWLLDALNEGLDYFRDMFYISMKYGTWIRNRGSSTYKSFLALSDEEIMFMKTNFLDNLVTHHIEDNKLFVHAGFNPNIGFVKTLTDDVEELYWNRSLFDALIEEHNTGNKIDGNFIQNIYQFSRIYIGHTPTVVHDIMKPTLFHNVLNLDQGCKINGKLTLWISETDEYIQTDEIND